DVQCVGTSATMTTQGDAAEQRRAAANVAATLFGAPVSPELVIGETLERVTDPEAASAADLYGRLGQLIPPGTFDEFIGDPLAAWIEEFFGIQPGSPPERPMRRRHPATLPEAAVELAAQSGATPQKCSQAIKDMLQAGSAITNPATGR